MQSKCSQSAAKVQSKCKVKVQSKGSAVRFGSYEAAEVFVLCSFLATGVIFVDFVLSVDSFILGACTRVHVELADLVYCSACQERKKKKKIPRAVSGSRNIQSRTCPKSSLRNCLHLLHSETVYISRATGPGDAWLSIPHRPPPLVQRNQCVGVVCSIGKSLNPTQRKKSNTEDKLAAPTTRIVIE